MNQTKKMIRRALHSGWHKSMLAVNVHFYPVHWLLGWASRERACEYHISSQWQCAHAICGHNTRHSPFIRNNQLNDNRITTEQLVHTAHSTQRSLHPNPHTHLPHMPCEKHLTQCVVYAFHHNSLRLKSILMFFLFFFFIWFDPSQNRAIRLNWKIALSEMNKEMTGMRRVATECRKYTKTSNLSLQSPRNDYS